MGQTGSAERKVDLELANMKRNPYLADYTEYKRVREQRMPQGRSAAALQGRREVQDERMAQNRRASQNLREAQGTRTMRQEQRSPQNRRTSRSAGQPLPENRRVVQWQAENTAVRTPAHRSRTQKRRAARRRKLLYQKIFLLVTAGCAAAIILSGVFALGNLLKEASAGTGGASGMAETENPDFEAFSEDKIQGLSLTDYGKHPTWTEDFLTQNEYSRPGEPLEEVNSIFVHYTANKGTSAAQNRSYFEHLKDTHETSASAHFIIGYEGEIIQCVPLDEIAYAVQTRNYDSVSIECCYLENDGSFTQETYDSLLRLLRWLMDVYDLDTEDVLRHYDCGGKKCPLYYTENPEEWEQLKREL